MDLLKAYDIQTISIAVQAGASIVLLIITIIYVVLTHKLLHAPHKAFLRPILIKPETEGWTLRVRNFGPGIAINLQIRTVLLKNLQLDPFPKQSLMAWSDNRLLPAHGPFQLMPNEEADYHFDDWISFEDPFYITWKSIIGKKFKTSWLIHAGKVLGQEDKYVPLKFFPSLSWKIKWFMIQLSSPYYRFKKWKHFRKASQLKRPEHKVDKEKDTNIA